MGCSMSPNPSILPYDDALQRPGVAYQCDNGFLRIVTPALGSWRRLGPYWKVSIIGLSLWALWPMLMLFTVPRGDRLPFLIGSLEISAILVLVVVAAVARLHRRFIFEVTRDTFSIIQIGLAGRRHTRTFRRGSIQSVHRNSCNGNLFIYAIGQDLIELHIPVDRRAVEEIAQMLEQAIREDAPSADGSLRTELMESTSPPPSPAWRKAMLGASVAMLVLAAALLITGVPGLWLLPLILAAVPAGITLGSQPTKFWT
jgi:hypothetical protein